MLDNTKEIQHSKEFSGKDDENISTKGPSGASMNETHNIESTLNEKADGEDIKDFDEVEQKLDGQLRLQFDEFKRRIQSMIDDFYLEAKACTRLSANFFLEMIESNENGAITDDYIKRKTLEKQIHQKCLVIQQFDIGGSYLKHVLDTLKKEFEGLMSDVRTKTEGPEFDWKGLKMNSNFELTSRFILDKLRTDGIFHPIKLNSQGFPQVPLRNVFVPKPGTRLGPGQSIEGESKKIINRRQSREPGQKIEIEPSFKQEDSLKTEYMSSHKKRGKKAKILLVDSEDDSDDGMDPVKENSFPLQEQQTNIIKKKRVSTDTIKDIPKFASVLSASDRRASIHSNDERGNKEREENDKMQKSIKMHKAEKSRVKDQEKKERSGPTNEKRSPGKTQRSLEKFVIKQEKRLSDSNNNLKRHIPGAYSMPKPKEEYSIHMEKLGEIPHNHGHIYWAAMCSIDTDIFATGGENKSLCLWSLETKNKIFECKVEGEVYNLMYLAKFSQLYAVCKGFCYIFKVTQNNQSLQELHHFAEPVEYNYGLEYLPDQNLIATSRKDLPLKLWEYDEDLNKLTIKQRLNCDKQCPSKILYIQKNQMLLVSMNRGGQIFCFSTVTYTKHRSFEAHEETASIDSLVYIPEMNKLVSGSEDSTIKFWDFESIIDRDKMPVPLKILKNPEAFVNNIVIFPKEGYLINSCLEKEVNVWNFYDSLLVNSLKESDNDDQKLEALIYNPDNQTLLTGGPKIGVWKISFEKIQDQQNQIPQFFQFLSIQLV